jgi:hypothetical protein
VEFNHWEPIQRICKYPLFFSDLCRQTPACDDPTALTELQKVLTKLQTVAGAVNSAMNNEAVRQCIEITWVLQKRLEFDDKVCELYAAE